MFSKQSVCRLLNLSQICNAQFFPPNGLELNKLRWAGLLTDLADLSREPVWTVAVEVIDGGGARPSVQTWRT